MANERRRTSSTRQSAAPVDLEDLFAANLRWLRGWLGARLRGRDRQEVDDLCQDILLRAFRGFHKLRDPDRFPAWLYRIATNVLRDHIRRAVQRRQEAHVTEIELPTNDPAAHGIDRQEDVDEAIREVLELPPKYREPMLLRHVDELSYAEISRILGVSTNAVQVRIFRARERLRRTEAYRRLFEDDETTEPRRARNRESRGRPSSHLRAPSRSGKD